MKWISIDEELPNDGESVVGMRADGWWHKVMYSRTHGWTGDSGLAQAITHWCRVTRPAVSTGTKASDKLLQDIKVGDKVFVVEQLGREQLRANAAPVTYFCTVTKVGRQYAYFERGGFERKFDRVTGTSWHESDSNARMNGRGFDVYVDNQTYLEEQRNSAELERLKRRLIRYNYGSLVELSTTAVSAIHAVLDAEKVNE
jgi:hypothetical protein